MAYEAQKSWASLVLWLFPQTPSAQYTPARLIPRLLLNRPNTLQPQVFLYYLSVALTKGVTLDPSLWLPFSSPASVLFPEAFSLLIKTAASSRPLLILQGEPWWTKFIWFTWPLLIRYCHPIQQDGYPLFTSPWCVEGKRPPQQGAVQLCFFQLVFLFHSCSLWNFFLQRHCEWDHLHCISYLPTAAM